MIICQLSVGSAEDIAAIEAVSNRPPWPVELFRSEFEHCYSKIYGARDQGKLVGFLVGHQVFEEIHILNFGVYPEQRGKGIGRKLLETVLEDSYNQGVHWATLEVRVSNQVAMNLYFSLGFFEAGIREKYYTDDQEDGLVLRCDLRSLADTLSWSKSTHV
jgi:ribosomal-protein-alanine N-acetyltransferase